MKTLKRYVIKTKSGKILRLKYELSADIEEYYEQGIEEDELIKNAIPKIAFYLTDSTKNSQLWTTKHKHICEKIIENRFDCDYNYSNDKFNSIDKPFLEITNEELTKEHYKIIQIEVSKVI